MKNIYYHNTPIGKLGILEENNAIVKLYFENEKINENVKNISIDEISVVKEAAQQLDEYFEGKRKIFTVPLCLEGTDFQKKVWHALTNIPYGNTASYKDIAVSISNEKASRAVGNANNKNPLPIFIPCHRVIGANGKLVGYAGGLDIKIKLLELESKNKQN